MKYFFLPITTLLLIGCSLPTLEEAITSKDAESVRKVLEKSDYDPNATWKDEHGNDHSIGEKLFSDFQDPQLAQLFSEHPSLTHETRVLLSKEVVSAFHRDEAEDWFLKFGEGKMKAIKPFSKALYQIIEPFADEKANRGFKRTLGEGVFLVFDRKVWHLFFEGNWAPVISNRPNETNAMIDVARNYQYEDLIESSDGRELVLYIFHESTETQQWNYYVKVYADPMQELADPRSQERSFWEEKLLFDATYKGLYDFDGSMDFPKELSIVTNRIPESADIPRLKQALNRGNSGLAFDLLNNSPYEHKTKITEDIWLWYEKEPVFSSWLVAERKILKGPQYHELREIRFVEEDRRLFIQAEQHPYVFIDAYDIFGSSRFINLSKIIDARLDISTADNSGDVLLDLEDPNFGITDDFEVLEDKYKALYRSRYYKIPESLLSSESQPFNITAYFKFFLNDSEEAKRILSSKWRSDVLYEDGKDRLDTADLKNGYMKVITPVHEGFSYTEFVYWNLSGGRKLFGVNQVSEEPFTGEVTTDYFEFKIFNEGRWEPAEVGDWADIQSKRGQQLAETSLGKQVFADDEAFELGSYQLFLPRAGKDIRITFNESLEAETQQSKSITLAFDDGKFQYQTN